GAGAGMGDAVEASAAGGQGLRGAAVEGDRVAARVEGGRGQLPVPEHGEASRRGIQRARRQRDIAVDIDRPRRAGDRAAGDGEGGVNKRGGAVSVPPELGTARVTVTAPDPPVNVPDETVKPPSNVCGAPEAR